MKKSLRLYTSYDLDIFLVLRCERTPCARYIHTKPNRFVICEQKVSKPAVDEMNSRRRPGTKLSKACFACIYILKQDILSPLPVSIHGVRLTLLRRGSTREEGWNRVIRTLRM